NVPSLITTQSLSLSALAAQPNTIPPLRLFSGEPTNQLKQRIASHCSEWHLHPCVAEFDFRYRNRREIRCSNSNEMHSEVPPLGPFWCSKAAPTAIANGVPTNFVSEAANLSCTRVRSEIWVCFSASVIAALASSRFVESRSSLAFESCVLTETSSDELTSTKIPTAMMIATVRRSPH